MLLQAVDATTWERTTAKRLAHKVGDVKEVLESPLAGIQTPRNRVKRPSCAHVVQRFAILNFRRPPRLRLK